MAYIARYDGVDVFNVKYDGAGTFNGNVEVGGDSSSGTEAGCYLHSAGFVAAARDNEADAVWRSFTAGDSTEKIAFTAGGSATFASTVKQGTFNGGQTATAGSVMLDGGGVFTQCPLSATASNTRMLRVYHGNNENVTVFADGSATFAGPLEAESIDGGTY